MGTSDHCLVEEGTVATAAQRIGVNPRSLKRWLADSEFQKQFAEVRQELLSHAVGRLAGLASKAVDAFAGAMEDVGTPLSIRAADLTLTHLTRGSEMLDLMQRVAEIERHLFGESEDEIPRHPPGPDLTRSGPAAEAAKPDRPA